VEFCSTSGRQIHDLVMHWYENKIKYREKDTSLKVYEWDLKKCIYQN
jgi:hypothetical protein